MKKKGFCKIFEEQRRSSLAYWRFGGDFSLYRLVGSCASFCFFIWHGMALIRRGYWILMLLLSTICGLIERKVHCISSRLDLGLAYACAYYCVKYKNNYTAVPTKTLYFLTSLNWTDLILLAILNSCSPLFPCKLRRALNQFPAHISHVYFLR